jgi:NAD-dependent dihydropyrimidine dehydrogenase PreA subunit
MKMTDQEIYQKFIDYLDNPVWEFTESEHMMPMITSFITPEEAEFMTGFPTSAASLEQIAAMKEMDPAELLPKIEALCRKGLVYEAIRGDSVRYRLVLPSEMFLRITYWSGKDEEPTKSMAPHATKYYMDGWYDQMKPFVHPVLRAIPIDKTVEVRKTILPFEDVVKVIDNYEYYTVSHCACRQRHKLDPDHPDSPFPSEVCLHFDELGRYIVKHGHGREITKEETLEILKKAADAGLVHGLENQTEDPETLCNCDLEYCTMFKPYHQLNFDKSMDKSNYRVEATQETCKACGICVRRCPMDAIQLKFSTKSTNKFRKAVVVDADLCLGCGVCVHKCKTNSITLKRREETTQPPKNSRELVTLNVTAVLAAKEAQERESAQ